MTEIGNYRYEGFPLAEKYGWMQQGRGSAAMDDLKGVLRTLAADYTASEAAIRSALGSLGATWQGGAADAAAGAMNTVAEWARGGQQAGQTGGGSVDRFAGSFAETKPKIPPPVEVGEQSFWGGAVDGAAAALGVLAPDGMQSDFRARQVAAQHADQVANAALYGHQAASQQALASWVTTDAPPQVSGAATPGLPGDGSRGGPGGGGAAGVVATGVAPASAGTPDGGGGLPGGGVSGGGLPGGGGPGGGSSTMPAPVGMPGRGAGVAGTGAGAPARSGTGQTGPGRRNPPFDPSRGGAGPIPPPRGVGSGRVPGSATPPSPAFDPRGAGRGGPGYAGGHSAPLQPRGGPSIPPPLDPFGSPGHGSGRGPAGTGHSGLPMGAMGGMGAGGGQDREHRNGVYIPSDEPFVVDFGYVAPPVLGLPDRD